MNIQDKISSIDQLKKSIEDRGVLSDAILRKINYKFRLDWNYYSNSMEGNTLTKLETRSIMIGNITIDGKPMKDVLDVKGHDEVIQQILKIRKGDLNISEKRIKELHKSIINEDEPERKAQIGEWKKVDNEIINYQNEKFAFTPPSQVPEEMHKLINWLGAENDKIKSEKKDSIHPGILAFEFHIRYLTIHPFFDGNGRTARILMNLILISNGYPPVIINKKDKEVYYQYLADVQCYDAPKDFYYDFMLGLLLRSMLLVEKAVNGEEIDEEDDLDKEIALLKIGNNKEAISISPEAVGNIYENVVKKIIESTNSSLVAFDTLFLKKEIRFTVIRDNSEFTSSNISEIDYVVSSYVSGHSSASVMKLGDISGVIVSLIWDGYKHDNTNTFQIGINYEVKFEKFNCYITNGVQEIRILYSGTIADVELNKWIQEIRNHILDTIKSKIQKK